MLKTRNFFKKAIIGAFFLLLSLAAVWLLRREGHFTFESLVMHRNGLVRLARDHYAASVFAYMAAVMSTAFFVPGAAVMTLAGGLLFGVAPGVLYFNSASVLGATIAFLLARHALGRGLQERYGESLAGLNRELDRHGHNYMVALRIVPVMPFFLMNYLAGLTTIPARTFLWTTVAGMLPGSIVYCYAGSQLGLITDPGDVLSPDIVAAFALLAIFSLLAPLTYWGGRLLRRS